MDVLEAIYTRRTIRKFLTIPVEFDKIIECVRAASYAPNAGNLQNWKFIIETKQQRIKDMYHHTLEQEPFLTAQAAVIVVAETEFDEKMYGMRGKRLYAVQNCAAAIENLLLAAHAQGLGGCWIGAFDENKINDQYSIPSQARAQAIVLLGYADGDPPQRHKKDVWYMIQFDAYGMKYQHQHLITHDMSIEWKRQSELMKQRIERKQKEFQQKTGVAPNLDALKEKGTNFLQQAKDHTKKTLKKLKKGSGK